MIFIVAVIIKIDIMETSTKDNSWVSFIDFYDAK